ncbi:hypothetical protein QIW53_02480 [Pseudomonas fluorescens]
MKNAAHREMSGVFLCLQQQSPVGAGLPAMAVLEPTMVFWVYISVAAVTAANGSALTAGHFAKACAARRKVTKTL